MAASEFRDPDYPEEASRVPACAADKLERTRDIIRKQFDEELAYKEDEIADIDKRMWRARRTLHRVRKALVEQYYARGTKLTHADLQSELALQRDQKAKASVSAILRNEQKCIHPTVRKFLGVREVHPDEMFKFTDSRSKRNQPPKNYSAMLNPSTAADDTKSMKPGVSKEPKPATPELTKRSSVEEVAIKPKKVPREDPQPLREVLTLEEGTRNRQKHKYRIIVGNTSKYAPSASAADRSTHKWLLYVRGEEARPDLSAVVSGVTVRLHESYAPHHVVHLRKPPFHVSRRGWGEFPATVQLTFALPERNRPAELQHTVRLDSKCTGLQTLGAETVVDVWLYSNDKMLNHAYKETETSTDLIPGPLTREEDKIWTDLFATDRTELNVDEMIIKPVKKNNIDMENRNGEDNVKFENETDFEFDELNKNGIFENALSNIVIKEEPLDMDELQNVEFDDLNLKDNVDVKQEVPEELLAPTDHNSPQAHNLAQLKGLGQINFVQKMFVDFEELKPKNGFFNGGNKNEPLQNNLKIPKTFTHIEMDHCYCMTDVAFQTTNDNLSPSEMQKGIAVKNGDTEVRKVDLGEAVARMTSVRAAVGFLLRTIPLITRKSEDYEFRRLFPFVVYDKERFWGLDLAKRRNVEWSRAKMINKILLKYFKDKTSIWRTKQILLFARLHGYCLTRPDRDTPEDPKTQERLREEFRAAYPSSLDLDSGSVFDETRFTGKQAASLHPTDEIELPCDSDDEVDITGLAGEEKRTGAPVSPVRSLEALNIEDVDERLMCFYIERKCMDIGVELRNEDVGSGYSHSAVHRVILQAVKCLARDIVRGALGAQSLERRAGTQRPLRVWDTGECTSARTVGLQHVLAALLRDERLQTLTAAELGAERIQYLGAL